MKVHRGIVIWSADSTFSGKFKVNKVNSGNVIDKEPITVLLTSPFFTRNEGGMITVPQEGSEVLYIYDEDFNAYYYLSTIVAQEQTIGMPKAKLVNPLINNTKLLYDDYGINHSLVFKDSKGAGLTLSNYHDEKQLSAKVELKSAANHKVILSDVPKMDCIIIRNRSGDGFTLTDEKTEQHSARSLDLKTRISQRWTTREGEYFVTVVDGRDLTLYNHSTGVNADANNTEQSGNINLNSVNRHINLWADGGNGASGSIFLTTYGANSLIQLNSSGEVRIYANKNLEVRIEGDINIRATGNINFEGANINFNTGGDVNIKAGGSIKAEGTGGIDLGDGTADLHLNKPGGANANPPDLNIPDPKKHAYQDKPILPPDLQPKKDSETFPTG